jgi:hypothetical protein
MPTVRRQRRLDSRGSWTARLELAIEADGIFRWLRNGLRVALAAVSLAGCCAGSPALAANDSYAPITNRLQALGTCGFSSVAQIGESAKGRPIYAVVFTKAPKRSLSAVPRELVISGQHGNEQVPVYATLRLMSDLASGRSGLPKRALEKVVLVFVPVVNPDGFAAAKRCNARNVDLNRNWGQPSQPETVAVTRLVERLRPNVLIDEHQWTDEDPNRPNCVEVPAYGITQEAKLARILADCAIANSPLGTVDYRPQANPTLAHRHFTGHGTGAMLVETGPGWADADRAQAYTDVVRSTVTAITGGSLDAVATMATLDNGRSRGNRWLASACLPPPARKAHSKIVNWAAVCLAAAGSALAWASRPKRKERTQVDWYVQPSRLREFSISDLIQSDLTPRDKLVIIHRCRLRPTDRPRTKAEQQIAQRYQEVKV